jgi:hypothetical protein
VRWIRQALAGPDGVATLLNIPAGTYRARISRDGYVTFEKKSRFAPVFAPRPRRR